MNMFSDVSRRIRILYTDELFRSARNFLSQISRRENVRVRRRIFMADVSFSPAISYIGTF